MSLLDYNKAYKLGEKEYKSCIAKGEYPYLPVLDDLLSHVEIEKQESLGLVHIPLKLVVGTYAAGRTTAFARNFMPILEQDSEFACKWSELYDSMIEEGLRDPIKAYEFNNKFYVIEGNKRVSVSKKLGSVVIEGNVTRMIPKKNDGVTNKIYYEFLNFYKNTKINYVDVTRLGTYPKLALVTGHTLEEEWSQEDIEDFHSVYTFFEMEFYAKAEKKLSIGAGDAFAEYLEIFGFEASKEKSQAELKKDIQKLWNEFVLLDSGNQAKIFLNPTEESKKQSMMSMIPLGTPVLKIAFIHDRSVQGSAWTYSHELGRKYIEDVFGDKIETSCIERVDDDTADDVFEAAIAAGNKVIFATTPKLASPAVRAAMNHPEVKILNCSMLLNHQTVRSYYLRTYEGRFITGAIAGSLCNEEYIGYAADYPIRGTTAEINAFALGVQMTNPRAKVLLGWKMEKDKDFMQDFRDHKVRIFSVPPMSLNEDKTKGYGLYMKGDDGEIINLAMPVRHWGKLYEEIIRSIMRGGYKNDDSVAGNQILNYFWGMSSGVIDVIYSRNLPQGAIRLLRNLRDGITAMDINPFTGPIYAQDGSIKCEDGQTIPISDIVLLDWLVDNIEGHIPDVSQLKDEAVELVTLQGVKNENSDSSSQSIQAEPGVTD